MGNVSYSAHISNGKSGITNKGKLLGVANHNLRKYKSDAYSQEQVKQLMGTKDLYQDVKNLYHKEFDDTIKEYNQKQARADRKIEDYFEHVAKLDQDMAVEIIFQCGDKTFWEEHTNKKDSMQMVFRQLLIKLEEELPAFKVANAVIHFDEASPHMHVVGVPVWEGAKRGLKKKVSKRNVFTPETLSVVLQDKLRAVAGDWIAHYLEEDIQEKKKGRNHDLTVAEYKVSKELERYSSLQQKSDTIENEMEEAMAATKLTKQEQDKQFRILEQIKENLATSEKAIAEKCNQLKELEETEIITTKKANAAEQVFDMMMATDSPYYDLREKLVNVIYENEKLKEENSKLKETLNKAYDYMKQFVVDGRNMLERFKENVGQVTDRFWDGFKR